MADMRNLAANSGDRLKHALLLETLKRIVDSGAWPNLTYAETHAGTGQYFAGDQKSGKIQELENTIKKDRDVEWSRGAAGGEYVAFLRQRWDNSEHHGVYPGSPLIARDFAVGKIDCKFRLTEIDPEAYEKLSQVVKIEEKRDGRDFGPRSFLEELEWLTGEDTKEDSLFLLVDPFGFMRKFKKCESCDQPGNKLLDNRRCECRVREGRIDFAILDEILGRCVSRERAVVSFWTRADKSNQRAIYNHLTNWKNADPRKDFRAYRTTRRDYNVILGIGGGCEVVPDIPSEQWRSVKTLGVEVQQFDHALADQEHAEYESPAARKKRSEATKKANETRKRR